MRTVLKIFVMTLAPFEGRYGSTQAFKATDNSQNALLKTIGRFSDEPEFRNQIQITEQPGLEALESGCVPFWQEETAAWRLAIFTSEFNTRFISGLTS
jgi:hypothetical protein